MFTLIFDIGKTNKKYFVFDTAFNVIEKEETVFPEIKDEDGFPCDDIAKISEWIKAVFNEIKQKYDISKVNFSTYGASFVHLDKKGNAIRPIYNYLKPFDESIKSKFNSNIGNEEDFSLETSSPFLGMLNSGLQLFWLKYNLPKKFNKISTSLHFPQYCSYLLTGNKYSEYTSIGCHTGLWDFNNSYYHNWVKKESLDKILAPIVNSDYSETKDNLKIGVGIHDSSAALVPYLRGAGENFILISTGTWAITLNPFNGEKLTIDELKQDCLQFMQPDGKPVKASRLFLGHELQLQLKILNKLFNKSDKFYQSIQFDETTFNALESQDYKAFYLKGLNDIDKRNTSLDRFKTFEEAYHQLIIEIVNRQIESINLALGNSTNIKTIYIDGGFTNNDLYCKMIAKKLPRFNIKLTQLASGSALGAAIIMDNENFSSEVFNKILKVKTVTI